MVTRARSGRKTRETWASALSASARFDEHREDLAVALSSDGRLDSTHTRFAGHCLTHPREPDRWVHRTGSAYGDREVSSLAPERPAAVLRAVLERLAPAGNGIAAEVHWVAFEQRVRIGLGSALVAEDLRRGWRLRLDARARRGARSSSASAELARGEEPTPEDPRLVVLADGVRNRLEQRLDLVPAPSGPTEVVLAPGVGGVLVHEIVGHALEADTVLAGASWLGMAEAPALALELTVIDDPAQARAPWRIDDEGQTARAVELLRRGRRTGLLHDRRTAALLGAATTGHGRRSTHRDPIRPRMGCTYIAPGTMSQEEILGEVRHGVYVRRMEAGSVDPAIGRAVFRVTDADRIVAGRIEAPMEEHILRVEGRDVVASLNLIGHDLEFDTCVGACHRDGQALVTSVGAPTVWIGVNVIL